MNVYLQQVAKMKFKSLNVRKSGSAALDMAYVGAGRYDGYFQKI